MNNMDHGNNRWKIIYGEYEHCEKIAVNYVNGAVSGFVPYVLTAESDEVNVAELANFNVIFIGTVKTNQYISNFVKQSIIKLNEKPEGYAIKVTKNVFNLEKQMIIIAGNDETGVMYGAIDFVNEYLGKSIYNGDHHEYYLRKLFLDEMPEFSKISSPQVKDRAIWTWGHVIYDYEEFINTMVRLKLNMLVIWNDFIPINCKDMVVYAHERSIKVIWGFSWGWGEEINIADQSNYVAWANKVIELYEKDYLKLGGDGIYFQTFTETEEDCKNDMLIAKAVVDWVNSIGGALLDKYPSLELQFGLHATSVKNHLKYIEKIDKRIHILWEDCGAFPYAYEPHKIEEFEATKELNEKICNLRGEDDKFGAVLKGCICLNWKEFEHQKGRFILGQHHKEFIENRTNSKKKIWKYVQAYWMVNANFAQELIMDMISLKKGNATIQILVEDGMLEKKVWFPVALYSHLLWDPSQNINNILSDTALEPDIYFA